MNTRILFLGLGMTALFLSASSWTSVFKISTHPENIYANDAPEIGIDSSGNSYITWEGYDGNDIDIYWTKVDFEGDIGEVKKISTHKDNIDNHDYDPQIAVDNSGNFYITWHGCDTEKCREEPGDLEIYWVKIDSKGNLGEVKKIPSSNPDYINTMDKIPQIAVDPAGNSYIVWSGIGEKSEDIFWTKIDFEGNLGEVQIVSNYLNLEYDDWIPQIAVDASGNSYITWEVFDGDNGDIYPQYSKHFDRNSWIAVNASGNCFVIFEGEDESDTDHRFFGGFIYWNRFFREFIYYLGRI
ncbi:MAG: hypothetical protein PVF58_10040 [Candidatus Methanofastidiosia archaeon]